MLQIIIYLVVIALVAAGFSYIMVKSFPLKAKLILNGVLLILALFLGYKIYNSIYDPVKFNKEKVVRYKKVVEKLKDIQKAEIAHKAVIGKYAGSFENLVKFIDTAQFVITQQRDSSYQEFDKNLKIDITKEVVVIDTLGFVPVKDSLFKNSDRYKDLKWVPVPGKEKQVAFEIEANDLVKSNVKIPVFRVRVDKKEVLYDQQPDLITLEKQIRSTKEINGEYIQIGSLDEVNDSGNWPKLYDIGDEKK